MCSILQMMKQRLRVLQGLSPSRTGYAQQRQDYEIDAIIPILKMKKLRLRGEQSDTKILHV